LDDILAEGCLPREVSEVLMDDEDEEVPKLMQQEDDDSDNEDDNFPAPTPSDVRRSTRATIRPERYCAATIKLKVRDHKPKKTTIESYVKDQVAKMTMKGRVIFKHNDEYEKEMKYTLHGSSTRENTLEYEGDEAYVIARMISEINLRATVNGKNFVQCSIHVE